MKRHKYLFIASLAILPFLGGCPDTKEVTTSINRDGSCIRTIGYFNIVEFEGIDSVKNDIPVPVDESWELVNVDDSTAVLMKKFESVDELNDQYKNDQSDLKAYKRSVALMKKFRWFHTIFRYEEIYEGLLTDIPITDYMSREEAEFFKSENTDEQPLLANIKNSKAINSLEENIEERFGYWLHDNLFSLAYDDIVNIADSLHVFDIEEVDVASLKDSVKQVFDRESELIIFDFDDHSDIIKLVSEIGNQLSLDSVSINFLTNHVRDADLDEKYNEWILSDLQGHGNLLIMPGQLLHTNAEIIKEDTLAWNVNTIKFIDSDYIMSAESRITNPWTYILSGIIIMIAVIIPFLKRR